jgi:hypothetical protein
MGYAIHQKKKDLEGVRKAMTTLLENHFNDPQSTSSFASTIVNQGRRYLAITVDSVSYVRAYRNLFILLGIELTKTTKDQERARKEEKAEL